MNKRGLVIPLIGIYLVAHSSLLGQVKSDSANLKLPTSYSVVKEARQKSIINREGEVLGSARGVLWQRPRTIENLDLFFGIGGSEGAPVPSSRFVFLKRNTSGSKEKIEVRDDQGRKWTVKFGSEAGPEVTATRIVWAMGFHVDQDYFVKRARIEGRGGFDAENVRFERDDLGYKTVGRWPWNSSPFAGTREHDGLRVLMALLNNYDLKTDNNKIIRAERSQRDNGGRLIYYVNDLGATLGSTGTWLTKLPIIGELSMGSKGVAEDFLRHRFIAGVENGEVIFHFKRRRAMRALRGIKVEHARWMGNLLSRLSDRQLKDAFRAGGFEEAETAIYLRAIRERIRQLRELRESSI